MNSSLSAVSRTRSFSDLKDEVASLLDGRPELFWGDLSNFCAHIFDRVESLNWVGFYILNGSTLYLGPFSGKPACTEIPVGKGVCGTSALERRPVVVKDVHEFAGHITCDTASRSEVVVPVFFGGALWGVFDLDSPSLNRFSQQDAKDVEALVSILTSKLRPQALRTS
jgi:GAF domain-containing protein